MLIITFFSAIKTYKNINKKQIVKEDIQNIEQKEPKKEYIVYETENEEEQQESITEYLETYTTRMTSFYPEEGETMTASGLGIDNFETNDKGWFTYNNKIVIATASTRLGSTDMRTYNLYDEFIVNIEGIDYDAIVLDVCGACMWDNRIDLFASSIIYAKDVIVEVKIKEKRKE